MAIKQCSNYASRTASVRRPSYGGSAAKSLSSQEFTGVINPCTMVKAHL